MNPLVIFIIIFTLVVIGLVLYLLNQNYQSQQDEEKNKLESELRALSTKYRGDIEWVKEVRRKILRSYNTKEEFITKENEALRIIRAKFGPQQKHFLSEEELEYAIWMSNPSSLRIPHSEDEFAAYKNIELSELRDWNNDSSIQEEVRAFKDARCILSDPDAWFIPIMEKNIDPLQERLIELENKR
jgi:hypothetical protein